MSEMIERVARAIMDADGDPKGCEVLDYQRERARAAIEAMREPTRAMCIEGGQYIEMKEGADHGPSEDVRNIWQDMIDAALTEAACSPACGPTILATQK